MKLLIAALLAVFSTSVMAEWTRVVSNDVSTGYADFSTIRKSGNKVKMWDLIDFKVVQATDDKRYLSTTSQDEYDCKEETSRPLANMAHARNMGQGEIVYMSGNIHDEFEPIPPGSVREILFKVACGRLSLR